MAVVVVVVAVVIIDGVVDGFDNLLMSGRTKGRETEVVDEEDN